jgi:hypothetical protein
MTTPVISAKKKLAAFNPARLRKDTVPLAAGAAEEEEMPSG